MSEFIDCPRGCGVRAQSADALNRHLRLCEHPPTTTPVAFGPFFNLFHRCDTCAGLVDNRPADIAAHAAWHRGLGGRAGLGSQ